jgi:hypothetical protein
MGKKCQWGVIGCEFLPIFFIGVYSTKMVLNGLIVKICNPPSLLVKNLSSGESYFPVTLWGTFFF